MDKIRLKIRIIICKLINKPLFIIQIENGSIGKISGNVKRSFVIDCTEIVKMNGLKFGLIYAINGQFERPILKVSNEISTDILQQFRNAWSFS